MSNTTNQNSTPAIVAVPVPPAPSKCNIRGCKVTGAELITCSASGCNKLVHLMCYQGITLRKNELNQLCGGRAVCTKKCYEKVMKEIAGGGEEADGGGRKGNWDCDGKAGLEDTHTSVKILIEWWMTEGNYSRFCGKNNNGIKKIQFAQQLSEKISSETNTKRDAKNVLSKIQHIERTFKDAHNFATSETGAGIKENDEGTFEAAVKKKCPYYYDLLDVVSDRASSRPIATSYNIEIESSSDEEDNPNEEEVPVDGGLSEISDGYSLSGSKRTEATDSAVASGEGSGKKSKTSSKKKSSPLSNQQETVQALQKAASNSEKRMEEVIRHHHFMESIESQRIDIERKKDTREAWKGKADELDYKMKLLEKYHHLKNNLNWSDSQIVAFFPDMEAVVEAQQTGLTE